MTMNPLPPQAYTRETLAKAYQWLRHQSDSVKELANTADNLIALYMRAQRHGDESLERPSLKNFRNELKDLAGMVGNLQDKEESPSPQSKGGDTIRARVQPGQPVDIQIKHPQEPSFRRGRPSPPPNPQHQMPFNPAFPPETALRYGHYSSSPDSQFSDSGRLGPHGHPGEQAHSGRESAGEMKQTLHVDAKSWSMIQTVKNDFNLSSEAEALRMIVSLGYARSRSMLSS